MQLTCREDTARAQLRDLAPEGAALRRLGLQHGDLVRPLPSAGSSLENSGTSF